MQTSDLAETSTATLAQVEQVVREMLGDDAISLTLDTRTADVEGWDSLANVSIIFGLEETFEVRLGDDVVAGFKTVGELVTIVDRARTATLS
jgi:acyl carrier protein